MLGAIAICSVSASRHSDGGFAAGAASALAAGALSGAAASAGADSSSPGSASRALICGASAGRGFGSGTCSRAPAAEVPPATSAIIRTQNGALPRSA
jgi:hypothetical protein